MSKTSKINSARPIAAQAARDADSKFGSTDLLLLVMTIIWGSNFTAIKFSMGDNLLPLSFNALRFVLASALMAAAALASGRTMRVRRGDGWRLFGLGLLSNALYQSLFIMGMAYTRAGNAALILATTPMFTAVISRIRRQEYFTARGVAGLFLAFGGIVLIILSGRSEVSIGETALGDCLLVAATACWALYTVGSKPLVHAYGPMKATAFMMITGTPLLLLICMPSLLRQNWSQVRPVAWAGLAYSGVFAIALAYIIWNHGVRKIGSTRTAIYSNITPVVALLVAWPALGEAPTAGQVVGAAIIFVGLYLVRRGMTAVAPAEDIEGEMEEASFGPGKN
ncbi:MAG TPA: DMT family transporter [Blastocatellia bacterium]|nr:DMT family transporter [Blastocatellia bacterium]